MIGSRGLNLFPNTIVLIIEEIWEALWKENKLLLLDRDYLKVLSESPTRVAEVFDTPEFRHGFYTLLQRGWLR